MTAVWQQLQQHADYSACPAAAPSTAAAPADAAPADRLLRATRAMRLGDFRAALSLLSQEAEEAPGSFLAFDLRAACCLAAGRHEQALEDALRCTMLNPDWARGWARLGAAQLCLGHPRAALSAYQRGLQMSPSSAEMQLGARLAGDNLAAAGGRRTAVRHADGLYE